MAEPADPHEQGLKPWHFIKAARTIPTPGATVKATITPKNSTGRSSWPR